MSFPASALVALFAVATFLNAALLFAVEPMFTKMVLPLLGGTPSVWNTCLLFFQGALLVGYLYAHVTSRWLTVSRPPSSTCMKMSPLWHSRPVTPNAGFVLRDVLRMLSIISGVSATAARLA